MIAPSQDALRALPCWNGLREIAPLGGGLSNAAFKVTDASGVYVARLGRDFPFHHVSRSREAAASRAAHALGLAPAVLYAGEGALVLAFIEGRTLAADEFRARLPELAALVKTMHAGLGRHVRGEASAFWAFHVIRDYLETLRPHRVPQGAARLAAIGDALEALQIPLPLIFGHHDLLPANVIDDGHRLWLIDWEYAGFGTPMFDLANLADNGRLDADDEARLLALYFGGAPDVATLRAFAAMKVASALREALWAEVSRIHLDAPGADYAEYAKTCFARFEAVNAAFAALHGTPE